MWGCEECRLDVWDARKIHTYNMYTVAKIKCAKNPYACV